MIAQLISHFSFFVPRYMIMMARKKRRLINEMQKLKKQLDRSILSNRIIDRQRLETIGRNTPKAAVWQGNLLKSTPDFSQIKVQKLG